MVRAAIVEDEKEQRELLKKYLEQFSAENNVEIRIYEFDDGREIVDHYDFFDVVFMDIQMQEVDGVSAAREIRKIDENVLLLFITNMMQYVLEGYEVEALDFVVKPVTYAAFSARMQKVMKKLNLRKKNLVPFQIRKETMMINVRDIDYVESYEKKAMIHIGEEEILTSETLNSVQEKIEQSGFYRCHNAYIVNMNKITRLNKNDVYINQTVIPLSRHRKKEFFAAVTKYRGMLL